MDPNLATTNLLLGIMAAVSVIEALALIGACIAGFVLYRRVTALVQDVERRHIAPAMTRVNALVDEGRGILADMKHVSTTVRDETARVDEAMHRTMQRVDNTVYRMRSNVRSRTSWLVGMFRGARVALEHVLQG
jgi:hypothetical protein